MDSSQVRRIRFGAFEVDLRSNELFKYGIRIKLQDQPFQILTLLLDHPGEVVAREELHRKLWTSDTFVDFDAGLNAAIRRLRDALSESAEEPRFIETLPRHGYRFIATAERIYSPIDAVGSAAAPRNDAPVSPSPLNQESLLLPGAIPAAKTRIVLPWLYALSIVCCVASIVVLSSVTWRRRVFWTHASSRIRSVAVLPLQNLSGDPSQEFFADGMTDALITDLARIHSLRVISRTSVMRYKNSHEPLAKIARDLEVDAVVEGSVVRAGNRVRINAQLIEAPTDRHLWASAFERDMTNVLSLQDEAARSIATEIAANLTPQEQVRIGDAKTVNPTAYEAYLRGNYFFHKETGAGYDKAKEYYEQSIKLDPGYAPAYVGLAEVFGWLAYTGREAPAAASLQAESLLAKALEIDATSSEAYVLRGMIKLQFRCDRSGAEKDLKRAMELEPGNVRALDYHSYYLLEIGQADESIAEKRRVVGLDPVAVGTNAELGLYFLEAGRNDEAIEQLKKTLELDPNFAPARSRLGRAYAAEGHYAQAIVEFKKAIALDAAPGRMASLGETYALAGRVQEALGVTRELEDISKKRFVSPTLIAAIYARLGDTSRAIAWLEKAKERGQLGADSSAYDTLRSNPRFKVIEAQFKSEPDCPQF